MNEDLPSINDFIEDKSNLPSIHESIDEDLPSYKDFLEKKEEVVEEEVLVEETVPQPTVVMNRLSSEKSKTTLQSSV